MSRRKQSKPRQIKRSIGDLEEGEDNLPDEHSLSEEEGGASDLEDSAECDDSSPAYGPLYNEEPTTNESPGTPEDGEEKEAMETGEEEQPQWNGPDELELCVANGDPKIRSRQNLLIDTIWGPYKGKIRQEDAAETQTGEEPRLTLQTEDMDCWLTKLPFTSNETEANSTIYSEGVLVYCKVTQVVSEGECLIAILTAAPVEETPSSELGTVPVKDELSYPAVLPSEIQLLPQQAGMAAILATAVVNKDIFPCKDCGIWYRSERNLQAHLMYYCASRQKQEPASPPQEKPKDSYPNERVCPFPHCSKSCPSASSLEIHMRTHSGERPFVCLICLSAFTTKANCERHLKVHTDTLNGICHGCGFISTTRDILYSHLVTNHMVCQPGSKSEVCSPGPGLPVLPLATGLNPSETGAEMKCQMCAFLADSPTSLQQHMLTHTEGKVKGEHSPAPLQSPANPTERQDLKEKELGTPFSRPNSTSPGANGGVLTPREGSPPGDLVVKIKEEPKSAKNSDSENEAEDPSTEQRGRDNPGNEPSSSTSSPKSLHSIKVKTEVSSPTPGSSPVHFGTGSMLPGGTVFLPQYMFSTEASIVPQASEILAKMSEMVHSRLKQGQSGAVPPFYAGSPIQKGATCFECDITFNNINNYYVHKRLYCSSRHHQGDNSATAPNTKDSPSTTAPASSAYSSPPAMGGSRAASVSHSDTEPEPAVSSVDTKMVEVKSEDPGLKDTSSEGESGSRVSEGSQSPSNSVEDVEDDPTKTFCEACNIRFSRHDNYIVHKRYYCASRHDPPNQRPRSGKVTFLPQPVRTRKRRKLYEIHMARNEALANPALPASIKQEPIALVGRPLEPPPLPLSLISASVSSTVPSPSSSPEGDGPIDLSKKPRLQEDQLTIPVLPLTDYHKCTACSISFNSIENYLAHKTYYCPATTLQQKTFEQLHRIKRPASSSPKSRAVDKPEVHVEHLDVKGIKMEKNPLAIPLPNPTCTNSAVSPGTSLPSSEGTVSRQSPVMKALPIPPNASPVVCPYCPLNGVIKGDLMEHFKNVHGLLLTMQGIGHVAKGNNMKEVTQSRHQAESHTPRVSPIPSPRAAPSTPPKLGFKTRSDSMNGRDQKEAGSPTSPLVNGNPVGPGATSPKLPLPVSPACTTAVSLNISPVPEALREAGLKPLTPPLTADKPLLTPKGPATPVQNGNSRYCRLCNIKFSSLSTFIAHKKYYCSSHSAEHVK
ncbi:zinc finger protein ZFPM1 isoform X2 [Amia ocellicauda]|uniref:zinc finger protein ZFPM1 isoform X2 n=1 Tax=Amia ocellicauda TaxID=2972642 RepID=UPI003464D8FF